MPPENDSWSEWQRHVLAELSRLSNQHDAIMATLVDTKTKIAQLEIRAGLWGALAGMIPCTIAMVMYLLSHTAK